jgi:ATP-binding cassette subfamily B protein
MMMAQMSLTRDRTAAQEKLAPGTVKRILKYAIPMRGLVIGLLSILVVGSIFVIVQPLLFRYIVDTGIPSGDRGLVIKTAFIIGLVALFEAALGMLGRFASSRIGEQLIFDLRTEVFEHVQQQSLAFFTRTQTGALVSRVNSDVIGAQRAFTSTLSGVLGNAIRVAIVLVTMFSLSWQITIASLVLVPIFLLPARWLGRRLQALTSESMNLNAEMNASMTEKFNVSGALLVKLFGTPKSETEIFAAKAIRVRDIGVKIAMGTSALFTALTLIATMATALVYGAGGVLTMAGTISLGTLLALVGLLAQLYGPLTALSNVRVDVLTAFVSFARIFEVLDLKPMVQDPVSPKQLPDGPLSVSFDHATFHYPSADDVSLASLESIARSDVRPSEFPVLEDVNFEVPAGHMVALVGPSGAGKTTTTSLIPRLYDVTAGAIKIGGIDVRELKLSDIAANVGVVTQDAHLFHDTIRANLSYAKLDATDEEMMQALDSAALGDLIAGLPDGLNTVVGDRGHRLSGGEKQRMAIARILLKSPRIVVLDEATAHLDSESEAAVQSALANALIGRTSVVIAHRLSTVRNANSIVVMDNGKVVQSGTHSQLLASGGLYADLYNRQFSD